MKGGAASDALAQQRFLGPVETPSVDDTLAQLRDLLESSSGAASRASNTTSDKTTITSTGVDDPEDFSLRLVTVVNKCSRTVPAKLLAKAVKDEVIPMVCDWNDVSMDRRGRLCVPRAYADAVMEKYNNTAAGKNAALTSAAKNLMESDDPESKQSAVKALMEGIGGMTDAGFKETLAKMNAGGVKEANLLEMDKTPPPVPAPAASYPAPSAPEAPKIALDAPAEGADPDIDDLDAMWEAQNSDDGSGIPLPKPSTNIDDLLAAPVVPVPEAPRSESPLDPSVGVEDLAEVLGMQKEPTTEQERI